jgi:hypothetical protein
MQCARAISYCHLWPDRLYNNFSTLSHKRHECRKKVIEYVMCVLIFSATFVWNNSRSKTNWARYNQKFILFLCIVTAVLVRFNENLICFTDFRKILKYQISLISIQCVYSRSMRTDRWKTYMTKLIVNFRKVLNAHKKRKLNKYSWEGVREKLAVTRII